MKSSEKLKLLTVADAKGKVLSKQEPALQEFSLDEKLRLQPGEQVFRFRAETPNAEPTDVHVTLVYQPPLPELELTEPLDDLSLAKGRDEAEIEVKGRFAVADDIVPFEVVVAVTNHNKAVLQAGNKSEPSNQPPAAPATPPTMTLATGTTRREPTAPVMTPTPAMMQQVWPAVHLIGDRDIIDSGLEPGGRPDRDGIGRNRHECSGHEGCSRRSGR